MGIPVMVGDKRYEALTHALEAIGFPPSEGKPYTGEIDREWRRVRPLLKRHGQCTVTFRDKTYVIQLCH